MEGEDGIDFSAWSRQAGKVKAKRNKIRRERRTIEYIFKT